MEANDILAKAESLRNGLSTGFRDEIVKSLYTEAEAIAQGSEPWVLDAPEQTALVRRLEAAFPTLAEAYRVAALQITAQMQG